MRLALREFVLVTIHCLILYNLTKCDGMCMSVQNVTGIHIGYNLEHSEIISVTSHGLLTCACLCLKVRTCRSVNFALQSKTCVLNNATTSDAELTQDSGYVFTDVNHLKVKIESMCKYQHCGIGNENNCHDKICLTKELSEIAHSDFNTSVSSAISPVGTVLEYICRTESDSVANATCEANGTWTSSKCRSTLPTSCREVKRCQPDSDDGEYWIGPENTRLYCHNMTGAPEEFLSLIYRNFGVYSSASNIGCNQLKSNGPDEEADFDKIRIEISSMSVVLDDLTFANGSKPKSVNYSGTYALAADCYTEHRINNLAPCGTKGRFTIDLRGTGWMVHPNQRWEAKGFRAIVEGIQREEDGAVIHLKCGGACGWCVPIGPLKLVRNLKEILLETCGTKVRCD